MTLMTATRMILAFLVLLTLLVRQARHLLQARLLWEKAGRPAFRDIRSFQSRAAPVLGRVDAEDESSLAARGTLHNRALHG